MSGKARIHGFSDSKSSVLFTFQQKFQIAESSSTFHICVPGWMATPRPYIRDLTCSHQGQSMVNFQAYCQDQSLASTYQTLLPHCSLSPKSPQILLATLRKKHKEGSPQLSLDVVKMDGTTKPQEELWLDFTISMNLQERPQSLLDLRVCQALEVCKSMS